MIKKIMARLFICFLVLSPLIVLADADDRYSIASADPTAITFYYEVKPGGSLTDEAIVSNFSSKIGFYSLSAADRQDPLPEDPPGAFALKNPSYEQTGIGKWVTFPKSGVTVNPNSKEKVTFKIQIPENTEKKDYEGGLLVELVKLQAVEDNKTPPSEDKVTASISISTRVGVRMVVKVTDTPKEFVKKDTTETSASNETNSGESAENSNASSSIFTPINIALGVILLIVIGYGLVSAFRRGKKSG